MAFKTTILCVFLLGCVAVLQDENGTNIALPGKDLRGESFSPPDDRNIVESDEFLKNSLQLRSIYLPSDLSDWERLRDVEKIDSVYIYGFDKLGGKLLDHEINAEYSRLFRIGISPKHVLRKAESDIGRSGGGVGGGTYLGVLKLNFNSREAIIVGVGQTSFFLDVFYGSDRQAFFSRPLAEALKRYLKDNDIELTPEIYEALSALDRTKLPEAFNEASNKTERGLADRK